MRPAMSSRPAARPGEPPGFTSGLHTVPVREDILTLEMVEASF
jgi:hypothetical protein